MKKSILKLTFILLIFNIFSFNGFGQTGQVTIDADKNIDRLLEYKKDIRTNDLYKIRIYSGDRTGAEGIKSQASGLYSEWPAVMDFETPNYKIYVGNFLSRLEADRALLTVKKNYPSALILYFKKDKKR